MRYGLYSAASEAAYLCPPMSYVHQIGFCLVNRHRRPHIFVDEMVEAKGGRAVYILYYTIYYTKYHVLFYTILFDELVEAKAGLAVYELVGGGMCSICG